jgi:hypothetical protein
VYTSRAQRSFPRELDDARETVTTPADLLLRGWSESAIRAQVRARRWQRVGRAIIKHSGAASSAELRQVALKNCGAQGVLTAFTAAEEFGLRSWERDEIHVLVPAGKRVPAVPRAPLRVHYTGDWRPDELLAQRRLHRVEFALLLAAATFASPRPACGLLAAGVQQRLITANRLELALWTRRRIRHRDALMKAVHDIGQGAHALSEIDFARLCRRRGLPEPVRQGVRVERGGRRRYLDAEWKSASGRRVVAEIDGALHLAARTWWSDQLRQNEIALGGDLVLRFPTAVFRHEPVLVADQVRRALLL